MLLHKRAKLFPESTAAADDDEITKMLIQITQRSVVETLRSCIMFSLRLLCRNFSRSSAFVEDDSLRREIPFFLFRSAETFIPASIFRDYFARIISQIFAKYRMITRWGNMSFLIYDYDCGL